MKNKSGSVWPGSSGMVQAQDTGGEHNCAVTSDGVALAAVLTL